VSAYAIDPVYQEAIDAAVKEYPPGDYNSIPVRRFSTNLTPEQILNKSKSMETIEFDLLRPVEMPDKDIRTLFSEAALYFTEGRFDLAEKRYKQSLLLEPDNTKAKANLFDIMIIRCLYQTGAQQAIINEKYNELKKGVAKDIAPKE